MTPIQKSVAEIVLLDNDKKEVARHGINAVVLLASPSLSEIEKLPKDDKGGFPLISYQFGEPQLVLALIKTLGEIIPKMFQKWADKLEGIKNQIAGSGIWTKNGTNN